jgi:hypothetical protein
MKTRDDEKMPIEFKSEQNTTRRFFSPASNLGWPDIWVVQFGPTQQVGNFAEPHLRASFDSHSPTGRLARNHRHDNASPDS